MIIGNINSHKNQIIIQNNIYLNSAIEIIAATDFLRIDDGTYYIKSDDFFYLIVTYKTNNISEVKAESHRKYLDFQYVIYGEELVGYCPSLSPLSTDSDYNFEKDVSLYNNLSNENFFIFKKDMFSIFYPGEIHRPGISNKETRSVRKAIFKIKT